MLLEEVDYQRVYISKKFILNYFEFPKLFLQDIGIQLLYEALDLLLRALLEISKFLNSQGVIS